MGKEVLKLVIETLTSFWFWFPMIFMSYIFLQLWLAFVVSPLTFVIVPLAVTLFTLYINRKRKELYLRALQKPFPDPEIIEEYVKMVGKRRKEKEEKEE